MRLDVVEGGDITRSSMGLSELFEQTEEIDYICVCTGSCDVGGGSINWMLDCPGVGMSRSMISMDSSYGEGGEGWGGEAGCHSPDDRGGTLE